MVQSEQAATVAILHRVQKPPILGANLVLLQLLTYANRSKGGRFPHPFILLIPDDIFVKRLAQTLLTPPSRSAIIFSASAT